MSNTIDKDHWFLNTRITVRISCEAGKDRMSVLEHWAPYGDSPPLHVHRNEDEVFHVLEGRIAFRLGDEDFHGEAGETVLTPKGIPHTYRVTSSEGARWLTITTGEDFERFIRVFSRKPEGEGLPEPSGPPTPEQAEALGSAAAQFGIDIVGPPLQ
jgi:mannose-6-phosphate isomerase-like protein (cupin superfamily)